MFYLPNKFVEIRNAKQTNKNKVFIVNHFFYNKKGYIKNDYVKHKALFKKKYINLAFVYNVSSDTCWIDSDASTNIIKNMATFLSTRESR